ncbi:MAG: DUF1330 domain-containing protein [Myxococcota bacterium]|nr:DUF1330 domain-containing protein [Myxococcota bacterium]
MAEVPVYLVVHLHVQDKEEYLLYEKGFFPILKKHGGQFITFDDQTITLEGEEPPSGRMVIFTFPSEEAAQGWYNDPEYQTLSEHRRAGTRLNFLTLVHGLPPR